jgi:hypothetical protein
MRLAVLAVAALFGASACSDLSPADGSRAAAARSAPEDQAAVDLLARTYTFGEAEAPLMGCNVALDATAVDVAGRPARRVRVAPGCLKAFPSLGAVTHWAPTGGASIALLGGDPLSELADFSPVQDGTGVYLRGGIAGDKRIYELRTPGT